MKKTYTQFFTGVLTLLLGVVCVQSASAQYTIDVDGQRFTLRVGTPGFFETTVTAPIVIGDSNCTPTNGSGAIVVMDADNACLGSGGALTAAHDNGAVAVIICGLLDTDGNLFQLDYDRDQAGDVASGANIDIPTFTATTADCDVIKVATEGVVDLQVPECDPTMPDNIVWGANGEGQFDGGLNGWSISNDLLMRYDAKGQVDKGHTLQNAGQIDSPTLCNGAVVADGAFADNQGLTDNFDMGPCPARDCEGRLFTPAIDLSGATNGLVLQFFQSVANFNSDNALYIDVDGSGETEEAGYDYIIPFNLELTQFQITQGVVEIALPEALIGETNVVFNFRYDANYFYWSIDDVYIIEKEVVETQINTLGNSFFVSGAVNFKTPASQADIIPLLADIQNSGNTTVPGGTLTATLTDASGSVLDQASLEYGDIPGGEIDQNRLFEDRFAMPTAEGTYTLTYALDSPNDTDASNNSFQSTFEIGDNVFSKVNANNPDELVGISPSTSFWSLGNGYHVINGTSDAGEQLYIESLRFGIDGESLVPGIVAVEIFEWIDLNGNGAVDADDGSTLVEITSVFYDNSTIFQLDATDNLDLLDVTLDLGENRIALKDNQDYIVMLHSMPSNPGEWYNFLAASTEDFKDYNYAATVFAFGDGSVDGVLPGDGQGTITENPINLTRSRSFSSTSMVMDNTLARGYFPLGNFTAFSDMIITSATVGTEDLNESIGVSVFPNPVVNTVFVDLELENVSENVNLQVVDVQGKVVMTQNFANVKADKLQLNVADLTTGIYVINIRTEEGFTSARFVKD